jgi:GT2 family glycosyltransferase
LATAPIVVFLDDDAIADRNWLAHLVEIFQDPRVLGAGGHIDPLWRRPPPRWFPVEFNWIVGCTYTGMPVRNGQVRNLLGANMAVRADVIRRTGGFTAEWGGGETWRAARSKAVSEACDETEFCIRASRLFPGGIWLYCPKARIQHAVYPASAQRTTWRYFVRRCRTEGTAKSVLTGSRDGLGSERRYVLTIAQSFFRYLITGNFGRSFAMSAWPSKPSPMDKRGYCKHLPKRVVPANAKPIIPELPDPVGLASQPRTGAVPTAHEVIAASQGRTLRAVPCLGSLSGV